MEGINSLSRVTGQEHNQMCCIPLGLVIDASPGSNVLNGCTLRVLRLCVVRALLNFLYLTYPIHTDTRTLELLDDDLKRFRENKDIFADLGLRDAKFNIPQATPLPILIKPSDNTNIEKIC